MNEERLTVHYVTDRNISRPSAMPVVDGRRYPVLDIVAAKWYNLPDGGRKEVYYDVSRRGSCYEIIEETRVVSGSTVTVSCRFVTDDLSGVDPALVDTICQSLGDWPSSLEARVCEAADALF